MAQTEFDEATGHAEALVRFETKAGTRFADRLYALVLSAALFPLAVFLPFGLALLLADEAGLPVTAVISVAVVIVLLCIRASWKLAVSKLRYCVVFHPDYLQVGRGLARCDLFYEDVEVISLPQTRNQGDWVKVRCGMTTAKVNLTPHDMAECASLLRYCCPNAIVIDEEGREHFPERPTRVDQALLTAERHYRRNTWIFAACGCFIACYVIGAVHVLTRWWNGNLQLDGFDLAKVISWLVLTFGATCCFAMLSWKSLRTVRRIRLTRRGSYMLDLDLQGQTKQHFPTST